MALTDRGRAVVANPSLAKPRTDADWTFQRNVASELFFAWQDAEIEHDYVLSGQLARVMGNVGMERDGDEWYVVTPTGGRFWVR